MEKGKIQFEPIIPPNVRPIYRYFDGYNGKTVIVALNEARQSITTLVYDETSNMPTDIYEETKSQLKIFPAPKDI